MRSLPPGGDRLLTQPTKPMRIKSCLEEWGSIDQTSLTAKLYGFKKQKDKALATLSGLDLLVYKMRYAQSLYWKTRIIEHKNVMEKRQRELDRYLVAELEKSETQLNQKNMNTNYNFCDLTPESKRMIFAQAIGYAVGARWVNIATNLDAMAAQFALAKGALEQSSLVSDDQIDDYFRAIDYGDISFFSSDSIDKLKSYIPSADKATVSFTNDEVEEFFSDVVDLDNPLSTAPYETSPNLPWVQSDSDHSDLIDDDDDFEIVLSEGIEDEYV